MRWWEAEWEFLHIVTCVDIQHELWWTYRDKLFLGSLINLGFGLDQMVISDTIYLIRIFLKSICGTYECCIFVFDLNWNVYGLLMKLLPLYRYLILKIYFQ